MARAVIKRLGDDILFSPEDGDEQRLPWDAAEPKLADWSSRYDSAAHANNDAALLKIGAEMFAWLDEAGCASWWADGSGDRELEIRAASGSDSREVRLLNAPWEVLAHGQVHLALDQLQPFVMGRRVGRPAELWAPQHRDLQLMFMAASPTNSGGAELDYEAEEAAILQATRVADRLHVTVEETGNLDFLAGRLSSPEGPFEALHLSCHGTIDNALDPVLLLESPIGKQEAATAADVLTALGPNTPPLVFLSACATAAAGGVRSGLGVGRRDVGRPATGAPSAAEAVVPLARQLTAQVANVIGWDGSVYDHDATAFATALYDRLAHGWSVPGAVASARQTLLAGHGMDREQGRHWHLARLYLGPAGGGALCGPRLTAHPSRQRAAEQAFLDPHRQLVPVATRAEFVGRRRDIQAVLAAFRDGNGVLVHGMGALGKSSLAARVVSRTAGRLTPVVIFERYDALAICDKLLIALPHKSRGDEGDYWRPRIEANETRLEDAVRSWLSGAFDAQPILLIIDDLERVLESPQPDAAAAAVPVKREYAKAIGAVLRAFALTAPTSRLLLTSRYDMRLADGAGDDLAASLRRVKLLPMKPREREKQLQAAARANGQQAVADVAASALQQRALALAAGNPGLQAVLTKPIFNGQFQAAAAALGHIQYYHENGVPPAEIRALIEAGRANDADNAVAFFFHRLSFQTYRDALTPDQKLLLAAASLFDEGVPIPVAALEAAGSAHGAEQAGPAVQRLLALGLFDDWGEIDDQAHAAANPLARPLVTAPEETDQPRLARAAWPALAAAWRGGDKKFPFDPRGVVAAKIALLAEAEAEGLEAATYAGAAYLDRVLEATGPALALIHAALDTLPPAHACHPGFLRLGLECADSLGEAALLARLMASPTRPADGPDSDGDHAKLDLRRAEQLARAGDVARAEALVRGANQAFRIAGDDRGAAIAAGQIADILEARGELEEALHIHLEEQLPVYERLGDVHSRAITVSKIADILQTRGELEEALRIRREEELPVFDRLGDVRSRAVTMGKIADILRARGEPAEALRIHREEELPVYERLGDVRARAVTMGKIADIVQRRGELEEALRIRWEEQLPVYKRLGDVREHAATMGKIAEILQARGEWEEALRIRREEQLPVYERLGDVRARAVTMGKIADILQGRGELREALRIRREEELPVFERLGDVRERAVTMSHIADILQGRGELEEALRIYREQLPVYDRLGDVRSRAITMGQIADILQERGELKEALRIRREEELPVYDRLGDVRSRAITMGQIADILQACGELEEALRIWEELLPVFDRLGDVHSRAAILQKIATGLIEAGGLKQGRAQEILDALAEAFGIARSLGLSDWVAFVGLQLAHILAAAGSSTEAMIVLDESAAAFRVLAHAEGLEQVRELRAALEATA